MADDLVEKLKSIPPEKLETLSAEELALIEDYLKNEAPLEGSFLDFCQATDPKFKLYPHVEYIAGYLQKVADGEIDRLMIVLGPRTGKSYLTSRLFAGYWLFNNQDKFLMLTGCTADLARNKFSVELRQFVTQPPVNMPLGPATGKDLWRTNQGGGVIAAGAGGTIIGYGADLLIIDDPFKSYAEAMSPATQDAVYTWYTSVATNRLEPGGKIIVINQRFTDNDLSGRILDQNPDDWTVLHLPSLCNDEHDPLGRSIGEALCPDRFTVEDLQRAKRELGPTMFESVHQGDPVPEGGSLFKRTDAKYFTQPDVDLISLEGKTYQVSECPQYLAADLAQSDSSRADRSVVAHILATPDGDMCVMNVIKGRWRATESETRIVKYAERNSDIQFAVIERSAGSIPSIEEIQNHMLVYDPPPRQAKAVRAVPLQILQERGKLWTPAPEAADWVTELEIELYRFPLGRHDDQVDALAWGAEYLDHIKNGDPEFMTTKTDIPSPTERVQMRNRELERPQSVLFPWAN